LFYQGANSLKSEVTTKLSIEVEAEMEMENNEMMMK
jgi:hypothetical protein